MRNIIIGGAQMNKRDIFIKTTELEIKDFLLQKLIKTDLSYIEMVKILSNVNHEFVGMMYLSNKEDN